MDGTTIALNNNVFQMNTHGLSATTKDESSCVVKWLSG